MAPGKFVATAIAHHSVETLLPPGLLAALAADEADLPFEHHGASQQLELIIFEAYCLLVFVPLEAGTVRRALEEARAYGKHASRVASFLFFIVLSQLVKHAHVVVGRVVIFGANYNQLILRQ